MSPLKWLKYLQFVEKLLGIYRNYCMEKTRTKCFIKFQIFAQSLLHTTILINGLYMQMETEGHGIIKLTFISLSTLACLTSMSYTVTALYFSRDFISYLKSVSAVSGYFKDDKQLACSLKRAFCISTIFNIILFMFATFRTTQTLFIITPSFPILYVVLMLVSQIIIRSSIIFHHFMMFAVVVIVAFLFKSLSSSISAVQERVGRSDNSLDKQYDITSEKIREWVELYRDLANCCDTVTRCFGRQYFFSLILAVTQLVLLTFQVLYYYLTQLADSTDCVKIVFVILGFLTVTVMPLIAGQMVTNQKLKFHRVLVRLYNTMNSVSDEAEVKLVKDFIRLIKKNPTEIKLSSKLPAGAYMLPVILSLAVNYVIVMLQFNHVI